MASDDVSGGALAPQLVYGAEEVEAYVAHLLAAIEQLRSQLGEALERVEAAEVRGHATAYEEGLIGRTLLLAARTAEEMSAAAAEEASLLLQEATREAEAIIDEARERARSMSLIDDAPPSDDFGDDESGAPPTDIHLSEPFWIRSAADDSLAPAGYHPPSTRQRSDRDDRLFMPPLAPGGPNGDAHAGASNGDRAAGATGIANGSDAGGGSFLGGPPDRAYYPGGGEGAQAQAADHPGLLVDLRDRWRASRTGAVALLDEPIERCADADFYADLREALADGALPAEPDGAGGWPEEMAPDDLPSVAYAQEPSRVPASASDTAEAGRRRPATIGWLLVGIFAPGHMRHRRRRFRV